MSPPQTHRCWQANQSAGWQLQSPETRSHTGRATQQTSPQKDAPTRVLRCRSPENKDCIVSSLPIEQEQSYTDDHELQTRLTRFTRWRAIAYSLQFSNLVHLINPVRLFI